MTPPIINRPEREGRGSRTAWRMLTAVAWLAYLYLWLPLITMVAWVAGARTAYGRLYAGDSLLLLVLPLIALVCGAVLLGWAEYNRARFGSSERRSAMPSVGDDEVAQALGADAATVHALRGSRIVAVTMDSQARPSIAPARSA